MNVAVIAAYKKAPTWVPLVFAFIDDKVNLSSIRQTLGAFKGLHAIPNERKLRHLYLSRLGETAYKQPIHQQSEQGNCSKDP